MFQRVPNRKNNLKSPGSDTVRVRVPSAAQKMGEGFRPLPFLLRYGTRTIKCNSPVDYCSIPAGRNRLLNFCPTGAEMLRVPSAAQISPCPAFPVDGSIPHPHKHRHNLTSLYPKSIIQLDKLEFFRVKEHLYEIRWIWFIRK